MNFRQCTKLIIKLPYILNTHQLTERRVSWAGTETRTPGKANAVGDCSIVQSPGLVTDEDHYRWHCPIPHLDTPLLRNAMNLAFITIRSSIEKYVVKCGHTFSPSVEISGVSTKTTWQVCDPI